MFNNILNNDFIYKCNFLIDKHVKKYKTKLNESIYLAIIVYMFIKYIYNYDHTISTIKRKTLFNFLFLLVIMFYFIRIYSKFEKLKNDEKLNKQELNYYYILIIISIIIIFLTIYNIVQQVSFDANKKDKFDLAVGGYSILLTASILTLFEIVFFYNIVIPGIETSLNISLGNISKNIYNRYKKYKSSQDEEKDLLKVISTVVYNFNNEQIINEDVNNDINQLVSDRISRDTENNIDTVNSQITNPDLPNINPPQNIPIEFFTDRKSDEEFNKEQQELAKDIILQIAFNMGIPEDLLTEEFIQYIINTVIFNADIPKNIAILNILNHRESIYTKHLNKYTVFISIIFLSILFLILSKFSQYIKKVIRRNPTQTHLYSDLFSLSKFSAYFTVFILVMFQINFYFFSLKYYLPGGTGRVKGLDQNKYGSGSEELQYLIYSNTV